MAPSRRKGANKAAAAAAAKRKWKVGDLVLAKVKGFPAWPAVVSEPEKWNQPVDWKKVFVYFFGTEQIAFCHPVDVEEFTEEKKSSLLGKRHGKGADFVRAVNEIIDCFENLKKKDQVDGVNVAEGASTNPEKSEESLTKPESDAASVVTVKSLAAPTGATNDLDSLTEAAVAAAAEDALRHEEVQMEEARSDVLCKETSMSTPYSTRSKADVSQSQNGGQRRISARRLRSSTRTDASRLHTLKVPSVNGTRSSMHTAANSFRHRSLRRSKRFRKSSDDSEGHDLDSHASTSNDSIEKNDSLTMTVESDTHSYYNDGSSVDSGCKQVGAEPFSDDNAEETELNDRLDFRTNTVITKKRRKHKQRRNNNDTVSASKLNVVVSETEVLKPECVSPGNNDKLFSRPAEDNGDEHLPLVKRARIRMGRPSPAEEKEDASLNKEEEKFVVLESLPTQFPGPLDCKVDAPCDGDPAPANEVLPSVSLSHASPKKPHFWETRRNLVDGEAALPPSKRLHRALEAMSANVAEVSHRASTCSSSEHTHGNVYSSSSVECSDISMENKAVSEVGLVVVEVQTNQDSQSRSTDLCVGSNTEISGNGAKTVVAVANCDKASCSSNTCDPDLSKEISDHEEGAGSKSLIRSPSNEHPAEHVALDPHTKQDSPSPREESTHLDCNTPGLTISPNICCETEGSELSKAVKGLDPEISQMNTGASIAEKIPDDSLCSGNDMQIDHAAGEGDETSKIKCLSLAENTQDRQRSELIEKGAPVSVDLMVKPVVAPLTTSTSSHHRALPCSNHVSDGPDSVPRASPPSSSICNRPASANNNDYFENNSSCSPGVQFQLEKAKLVGKSNSKVDSLSTFEAVISSLTRTKDCISRATRAAIECAKYGLATKVVEILARSLERESSSHKKVDLFFLVDSITQFSRGMKGDCGIYPSAIQPLLPRLLLAAAPPGSISHENHRQCLKVLKVWQDRNILPEPIIRHHIRELDALCNSYPTVGSRRHMRNERAIDDPIREMEGMLVDEYGSNSSFQLPGFCMPPMLKDDDGGSDSDGESFEAVTPEHNGGNINREKTMFPLVEKRSHILEDVDGELEMEDVAPCCEVAIASSSDVASADCTQLSYHQSDNQYGAVLPPQQYKDVPLTSSAHLPRPLPPPPPPPPHPILSSGYPPAERHSVTNEPESKFYSGSQNFNAGVRQSMEKHPVFPRAKPISVDSAHHRRHDNKDFEMQVPRQMPDCNFSDRPTSHLPGRVNDIHPADAAFSKGFHLRPPHPAPSNQFSYVQERIRDRDIPPPSHPNRFHTRNAENGNFYRDRDRNKFPPRDHIGECWRPPLPSISGPCYHDDARMPHASTSYSGPPREPPFPNNRWNYRPRSTNHRHFNPYRPPSEGPIPVANRGPNFWRPR